MGFQCKTDCQLEISPGVFKLIQTGQTHFDVEMKRPILIKHVKPVARKFFVLSGNDIKIDIEDKRKIIVALGKRNINVPKGARTSDVARLLAIDNKRRGLVNLESLETVAPTTHIADKGVIDAKARIDELFDITHPDDERPYSDDTSLDTLLKVIDDKEAEIAGAGEPEPTNAQLKEKIKAKGGEVPAQVNKAQLKDILSKLEADEE